MSGSFDAYVGDIMDGLSKDELRSLKKLIVDSYEVGPQNWTDNFRDILGLLWDMIHFLGFQF